MTVDAVAAGDEHYVVRHREIELRPREARICLTVFVINEGERLHRQLQRMAPYRDQVDIVVADGGSVDGSVDVERLRGYGVRALLVKEGPGRLGAQMVMAFDYMLREGYDAIIVMDGNNKDDPSAIPRFLDALHAGFQHVQGSRYIAGGVGINTPFLRKWGVRLLHAPFVRLAARWPYTDTTNGFRAYDKRLLDDPRVMPFRRIFSGYELHYYLAIRAGQLGYRICEVPVTRAYPSSGPVPTKISGLRGNVGVLQALFAACRGRFDPPRDVGADSSARA